jgi:hypothetical protein
VVVLIKLVTGNIHDIIFIISMYVEEVLCFFTPLRKTSFLNTGNVAIGKSTGCATPDVDEILNKLFKEMHTFSCVVNPNK